MSERKLKKCRSRRRLCKNLFRMLIAIGIFAALTYDKIAFILSNKNPDCDVSLTVMETRSGDKKKASHHE